MDMRHFFRVVAKDLSFFKSPEGQMLFPTYGDSGGPNAQWLFYYDIYHQIGNTNPLAGAYIDQLAVPNVY